MRDLCARAAARKSRATPPAQLLARLLAALLDCGDLAVGRTPPGGGPTKCLTRLVLAGVPDPHSLTLAACALVALSQASQCPS